MGYRTAIVGKWHLGHAKREFWPRQRGFDYQYGPLLGEIDYLTHEAHGVREWFRNDKPVREPGYVTTLLGKDAARLIGAHDAGTPLFLYLTFTAPHSPYQAPQEYLERYKDIADPTRRAYAAMITAMDDEVGRVVDALVKKRMRDDTLIVFQSDNGGNRSAMFAGEIDVSKLKLPSDNGPYREGKGTLFEGGTRFVAVANWPGHIKPGPVNEMMHVVDMYPTLTKLAHVPSGDGKPVDGMDVWATISEGAPSPRTEVVYNVEPFRAAIRQGDWKLIWRTPLPGDIMLFDLRQDPSESNDLAARHPEKVAELQERAKELARQSAKPLFLLEQSRAMKRHAPPMLPNEDAYFNAEP
jgi:arylsulfatase A-like enzyme